MRTRGWISAESQYCKSGSTFFSSEPVAACSDSVTATDLETQLARQTHPSCASTLARALSLILQPTPSIIFWNSVLQASWGDCEMTSRGSNLDSTWTLPPDQRVLTQLQRIYLLQYPLNRLAQWVEFEFHWRCRNLGMQRVVSTPQCPSSPGLVGQACFLQLLLKGSFWSELSWKQVILPLWGSCCCISVTLAEAPHSVRVWYLGVDK